MKKYIIFVIIVLLLALAVASYFIFNNLELDKIKDLEFSKNKKINYDSYSVRQINSYNNKPGIFYISGYVVKNGENMCFYQKSDKKGEDCYYDYFITISEKEVLDNELVNTKTEAVIDLHGKIDFQKGTKYNFLVDFKGYENNYPRLYLINYETVKEVISLCDLKCENYSDINCPDGCISKCEEENKDDKSCVKGKCMCPNDSYFDKHPEDNFDNFYDYCKAFNETIGCEDKLKNLCEKSGGNIDYLCFSTQCKTSCNCEIGSLWNFKYGCGSYCRDNNCENINKICNDSDGGDNYFIKGYVKYKGVDYYDYCKNKLSLIEYGCQNFNMYSNEINCGREGCFDGRCEMGEEDNFSCKDTDNGKDYFKKGYTILRSEGTSNFDICFDKNTLIEYYCQSPKSLEVSKIKHFCINGCEDGVCITSDYERKCTDSDGGKNYYKKGTTSEYGPVEIKKEEDKCFDLNRVAEYYCTEEKKLKYEVITCPNKCNDGACLIEVEKTLDIQ